nr:oligosaccharide flippase family protein [Nitrospira defluvii]
MCLLLSRYLALPLNVVTGILLARVLGPEELGRYALMVWLPSVLAGPMSLGLGNANLYFGARDRGLGPSLVANSFAVSLGFFFIVICLLCGFPRIAVFEFPLGLTIMHFVAPLLDLPFRLATMFAMNLLNAWEDHAHYRITEIIQTVAYFVCCIVAVFVLHMGLWGFIGAQIAASIVTSLYTIRCLWRHKCLSLRMDWDLLRRSLSYGMQVQVGSITRIGGQKLDELILLYFTGMRELGLLTLARNLTNRFRVIPYSLSTIIGPRLSKADQEAFVLAATATRRMTVVMSGVVAMSVIAVGPLVPLVYGQAYIDVVLPVRIFLLMLIPLGMQRMFAVFMLAVGETTVFLQSVAIGAIAVVLLDFVLIPSLGVNGAVIASAIAITIETYYVGRAFLRYSNMRCAELFKPTMEDSAYFVSQYKVLIGKARGEG